MKVDLGNRVALSGLVVYTVGNYNPEYKAYSMVTGSYIAIQMSTGQLISNENYKMVYYFIWFLNSFN